MMKRIAERQAKRERLSGVIEEAKTKEFTVKYTDGRQEKKRLFISTSGDICYFAKKRRTRGYAMDIDSIEDIIPKQQRPNDTYTMFHRNVTKAAELLLASGMWPDLQKMMAGMATLTLEEYNEMTAHYDAYDGRYNEGLTYDQMKELQKNDIASFNAVLERKGHPAADIYHFNQLKSKGQIISVPFSNGNHNGDFLKSESQRLYEEAKNGECGAPHKSMRWYGSYDYSISFEKTNSGELLGWYSAEYKGCGNGHYYLLLDATHALYYEDD